MTADDSEWPVLLADYQSAIVAFESTSRALMAALTERNATDEDLLRSLVVAEERAREAVILARMRLINLWRASGADLRLDAPFIATPTQP